jgi:hypothetical protein
VVKVIGAVIEEHRVLVDGYAAEYRGYLHQWKK